MLNELKRKEVETVKAMVDAYKASIDYAKAELDVIDEKYRKLIEQEKKELKETLSMSKTQLKVWEKMFNSFDSTLVKEVLGYESTPSVEEKDAVETTTTAEEDTVVDNLFPENNEEIEKSEEKESEETPEPVPVLADSTAAAEPVNVEWPVTEEKEVVKLDDFSETTTEAFEVEEKKELPALEVNEDGWPEFPEDWK